MTTYNQEQENIYCIEIEEQSLKKSNHIIQWILELEKTQSSIRNYSKTENKENSGK